MKRERERERERESLYLSRYMYIHVGKSALILHAGMYVGMFER